MSSNNPNIKASDIISNVESRLGGTNLDNGDYLPWISYGYQKLYSAIVSAGQQAKEYFFGDLEEFDLVAGTAEYPIEEHIPRFGGIIKVEIKYGGTNDDWIKAQRLPSLANWQNQSNTGVEYRSKQAALYYILGDNFGFIPTPSTDDTGAPQAKVWYVKRPYQVDSGNDIIDIPYRYLYPLENYVQAKAIEAESEDYGVSNAIEAKFVSELAEITALVTNEFDENDNTNSVHVPANSSLYSNPIRRL